MLNKFLHNLTTSLFLTLYTGCVIFFFGFGVAICDNFSSQVLRDLFVILPICMLIVLVAELYSAYHNQ